MIRGSTFAFLTLIILLLISTLTPATFAQVVTQTNIPIDHYINVPLSAVTVTYLLPRVLHQTPARYTDEAIKAHMNGTVRLGVHINPSGNVGKVDVLEGLRYGLSEQATKAVKSWLFESKPYDSYMTVDVIFSRLDVTRRE